MSLGRIGESLPKEWEAPLLTELSSPRQWKTISTKELLEEGYVVYGANGKIGFYSQYTHEFPTLMITCRGATCGNLHVSEPFSYINGNAMALDEVPTDILGINYLRHALEARGLEDTISGSAQPQITRQGLSEVRLPLPPLAEQKVIAEKLDTLLAQVDTTKARLERIPDIIKRFRQSVLAAAVSGKLTEEWRKTHEQESSELYLARLEGEREDLKKKKVLKKGFGPKEPAEQLSIDIPTTWSWTNFEYIAANDNNALKAGPFGSALKKSDCVNSGYKVYGQEQVIAGDENLETYYISEAKYQDLESCSVKPGDILISLVGTIGKVLVLSERSKAGIINPRLVKLSLQGEVSRDYIRYYLNSPLAHDYFKGFSHGGTMDILNLGILKGLPISFPPTDEQTEIVRRVEELFAFSDTIEQKAAAALERVNNLTQSILAKAFRGELTADWRAANPELISGDNSAAALLAKIQAEREALALDKKAVKKPRKKKA